MMRFCVARAEQRDVRRLGGISRPARRLSPPFPASGRLLEHFRIPTPAWAGHAGRGTSATPTSRARELGIPSRARGRFLSDDELGADRRRAAVRDQARDQGALSSTRPVQGVARRHPRGARARAFMRRRGWSARGGHRPGADPGRGDSQLAYCAFFKDGARVGEHDRHSACASIRSSSGAPALSSGRSRSRARGAVSALPALDRLLRPGRARVQARPPRRA